MSYENENNMPELTTLRVSFEDYRILCDQQSESYRKVGILSQDGYNIALSREDTEFVDLPGVGSVPLVVGDEAMDGYDISRTRQLTGKARVFLLALPVESVPDNTVLSGDYTDAAIVVESARSETASAQKRLPVVMEGRKSKLVSCEFVDERIEEVSNKTAWMSIYTAKTKIINEVDTKTNRSMSEVNKDLGGELRPVNGLTLYSGSELVDNPDIADALWSLFQDRFGWLGDYHPVSMEDTRELFDQLVMGESSFVTVKYVNGEPVCAGIFMHDLSDCSEWLSDDCVDMLMEQVKDGYTPMFFPGIAARAENVGSAKELIGYHCRVAAEAGVKYALSFESSNMSSTYIPRLVADYVSESGTLELDGAIETHGTQDYWFLKSA